MQEEKPEYYYIVRKPLPGSKIGIEKIHRNYMRAYKDDRREHGVVRIGSDKSWNFNTRFISTKRVFTNYWDAYAFHIKEMKELNK